MKKLKKRVKELESEVKRLKERVERLEPPSNKKIIDATESFLGSVNRIKFDDLRKDEVTKEDIDNCIRELNPSMFGGYTMPYPEYLANSKPLTEQQLQRNKEYFEKEYGLNAVPETITGDK